MSNMAFEVAITATAEVRDKDGNLISAEPVESKFQITEEQARALLTTESEEGQP